MTRARADHLYCTPCNRGLHNKYRYLGGNRVELIKPRCKGELKCECKCLTHFEYDGKVYPIGIDPTIRSDVITESKTDEQKALAASEAKALLGPWDE